MFSLTSNYHNLSQSFEYLSKDVQRLSEEFTGELIKKTSFHYDVKERQRNARNNSKLVYFEMRIELTQAILMPGLSDLLRN